MEKTQRLSDEKLMQQLRQGHLASAGPLFERYHVRLYNFFFRLCGDRNLSEDLTQSVFERLIRYRQSYVEGMSFRSWIYQIARNVRIDEARKNRMKMSTFSEADDVRDKAGSASRQMEQDEESRLLHRALARLSGDQRELLVLTRFQGMKYKEVADLMNTTEGAIKVRVHRAIQELRDLYFKMSDVGR